MVLAILGAGRRGRNFGAPHFEELLEDRGPELSQNISALVQVQNRGFRTDWLEVTFSHIAQYRENSLDEHQEELTLDPFLKSKKSKTGTVVNLSWCSQRGASIDRRILRTIGVQTQEAG
jgi:hypothetical protein